jgi:hypothetical protein
LRRLIVSDDGVAVLPDCPVANSATTIDLLAVGPAAVFVVGFKDDRGQVTHRNVGGLYGRIEHLFVGRRDCTKFMDAMAKQATAVTKALAGLPFGSDIPVVPVICFQDAGWAWFTKPFQLKGVWVCWPEAAAELVQRDGMLTPDQVCTVLAHLVTELSRT